jgi:hypothetical protein
MWISSRSRACCSSIRPRDFVMLSNPSTNFSSRSIMTSNFCASWITYRVTFQEDASFWCFRIRLLNRSKDPLKIVIPREIETSEPRALSAFNTYRSSTLPASSRRALILLRIRSTSGLISGRSRFLSYRRRHPWDSERGRQIRPET